MQNTKISFVLLLLLGYAFLVKITVGMYVADRHGVEGKRLLLSGDVVSASEKLDKAIRLNPYEPTYKRSKAALYVALSLSSEIPNESKKEVKEAALTYLDAAYKSQPYNMVNIKGLLPLYTYIGVRTEGDVKKADEEFVQTALNFSRKVEGLSPTDASFVLMLAEHYDTLNDAKKAGDFYKKAYELRPKLAEQSPPQKQ